MRLGVSMLRRHQLQFLNNLDCTCHWHPARTIIRELGSLRRILHWIEGLRSEGSKLVEREDVFSWAPHKLRRCSLIHDVTFWKCCMEGIFLQRVEISLKYSCLWNLELSSSKSFCQTIRLGNDISLEAPIRQDLFWGFLKRISLQVKEHLSEMSRSLKCEVSMLKRLLLVVLESLDDVP